MIGFLQGKLLAASPDRVLLDVGGVGYEIHVPLSTFSEIQREVAGGSVGLYVHTHVRADAIELFGFHTEREKLLFEKLLGVGGIGPRLARVILSGMPPEQLIGALASGDTARLATIPGVGKKTAQRMVVELKDKAQKLAADLPPAATVSPEDDLVLAMVNLGYKPAEAERAVSRARAEHPDGDFQEILKASLKSLSRV